jgi:hypothetical protein
MIGKMQLSVTAMRPGSKREALDDSFFISPEPISTMNRNRVLSTDGETSCTTRTEVEVKKAKG